jgi:hypothetical protein
MDIQDFEESLDEILNSKFKISYTKNGKIVIHTELRVNEDGEVVDFDPDEDVEDPDIDPDFESLEDDDIDDDE